MVSGGMRNESAGTQEDRPRPEGESDGASRDDRPILVGVGASSSSIEGIARLVQALPPSPDWATIFVPAHREAFDEVRFRDAVAAQETLRIEAVEDGAAPKIGTIYLCDPDGILTIRDGLFQVRPAEQAPGHRGTIDSFLVSLAEDQGERAIGVVLQGTGGDGTLGIATLKEHDGLAIAELDTDESPDEAATGELPAALADFVVPAEQIPERIVAHIRQLATLDLAQQTQQEAEEVAAWLARIATILRNKTGHDFHGYKSGTFMRRVRRRMHVLGTPTVDAYAERLRTDVEEIQNLFNDLLIGVTHFFRDKQEFELLETRVVPDLLDKKGVSDQFRVWVLGCATGEEAYSLAILLREQLANREDAPRIQIFATDIDVRALAAARAGRYSKAIEADLTPERLARWFVKEGDTYCVVKELREMCIFSSHNVTKDAPFSRLDLVSCRNLLIYLDSDLQGRVIPLFHFALRPGGILFLGNSENVTRHGKLFEPLERRSRIFRRLEGPARTSPEFPISAVGYRPAHVPQLARPPRPEGLLDRRAERIVERFAPAYVIVNEVFEVIHFSGPVGPFLGPMAGAASLDLLKLVHRDLRSDLRAAIRRSTEQDAPVEVDGVHFQIDGREALVQLFVSPMQDRPDAARHFVVVFKDAVVRPPSGFVPLSGPETSQDERIERLEADLAAKSERLQATIEELESTNEELTSSNEEYQSLNEELQSANEELETSKEELQSINEELNTVNSELAHRVQELTSKTSDLKNFLESTQIATLFLDNELRVTNFTPSVKELFHLIESDIGRPLAHIRSRIPVDELFQDVGKVLRTLSTIERTVEDDVSEACYIVRVLPYRSVDNFIAGVVVTFTNVTLLTRAEAALRTSEARLRAIFESAAEYAIIAMDRERRITAWNPGGTNMMGWEPGEVLGRSADILFTPEDRATGVPEREAKTADEQGRAADERWHVRKDGTRFWGSGVTTPLQDGERAGYLKILTDRTNARAAEERQRVLLGELQHRVRNTLGVVRSIARRTAQTSETVDDYAMHLDGRLNSLARVQSGVTRDPSAGLDLAMLVAEELLGCAAHEGEQLTVRGPDIRLQPKAAETLGLALHELATNALKYGALVARGGHITVTWTVDNKEAVPKLLFEWVESGVSLDPDAPRRRGFGIELLERMLAYELNAESGLEFRPDGLRCLIRIPMTERFSATPILQRH
jgi:two-component system CheB/CheR fusion protein